MEPEPIYRIRVLGQLGTEWSAWFAGLEVAPEPNDTTVISGPLPDQAALHGVLASIRDFGLVLLSVETLAGLWSEAPNAETARRTDRFDGQRPATRRNGDR